jgi:hypothetical protein
MVSVMRGSNRHTIASGAHELQRAAGRVQQRASDAGSVAALPPALAHMEEALERLATGVVKAAQAVEDWALESGPSMDREALSPEARALRWHLFHLSARLRSASDACPDTRRWARELLREPDIEGNETSDACSSQPAGMQLEAHGG